MLKRCISFASALGLLALLLTFPVKSSADTILSSNLGPGNSYDPSAGRTVYGSLRQAMPFVPSESADLSQIVIALSQYSSVTTTALVTLYTDNNGLPGSVMESWSLTGLPIFGSTSTTVQILNASPGVLLSGGTTYWLVAAAPLATDVSTSAVWVVNSTGAMGYAVYSGATWYKYPFKQGAFAVMGTPTAVPEPSAFILLGCGLLGLLLFRRSRHQQA